MTISRLRSLAVLGGLWALTFAGPALAQGAAPDFSAVQIRVTRVAGNLYALEGQGGTVSVLAGPDGAVLIDSQFAPLSDKLIAAVRTFTQAPLRFLINTHVHGDHTGGNANFAKQGATIIAHDNVRTRLLSPPPDASGAPGAKAVAEALPVLTIDGGMTLHLNDTEMRLSPLPAGHTDGDILIEFPTLDVMVVGDFFRTVGYPVADATRGGSLAGIARELGVAISKAGPKTRIIPGHGPIADRAAMIAQRDLLMTVRAQVAQQVAQGMTVEQVLASKPTAAWDASVPQGAQAAERFVRSLHAELSAERR